MSGPDHREWVEKQARQWILVWNDGDPRSLPLAEEFEHSSPYGQIFGRERYLDTVIPQAASSVMQLTVDEVIVGDHHAAVRYRMESQSGRVTPACDWLEFSSGKLARVWSYYDRAAFGAG